MSTDEWSVLWGGESRTWTEYTVTATYPTPTPTYPTPTPTVPTIAAATDLGTIRIDTPMPGIGSPYIDAGMAEVGGYVRTLVYRALATDYKLAISRGTTRMDHALALIEGFLLVRRLTAADEPTVGGDRYTALVLFGREMVSIPYATLGHGVGYCERCGADAYCAHVGAAEILCEIVARSITTTTPSTAD